MGIKGIYNEIGPGERIALSKLAVDFYERKGQPFRLAIDISIWLFQIQSGKGGSNPALRTFYYRLLRLISLSIHPLFVFDGPNKPPFKRNKRTGVNVASIPEFLAKQLLKQFGLPFHIAPGEAEAECALLQKKGIVDAVLSEDVDTLMFGSKLTLRNWSFEGTGKIRTHVNLYDAEKTKHGRSGLDSEGMILVALMSGGDYTPEGIPGCGHKTACEAARAGFGADLCKLARRDSVGLAEWKEKLSRELRTNESKLFRTKHKGIVVPNDFPRSDILGYYARPCVSTDEQVTKLRDSVKWDQDIDFQALRTFTGEAFEWLCVGGAKKFIRNLAPALLVKQLRLRAEGSCDSSDDPEDIAKREKDLVEKIYMQRQHASTDGIGELRVGFTPLSLVPINLDAEDPDPEVPTYDVDSEDEDAPPPSTQDVPPEQDAQTSPRRKRSPPNYDPSTTEKAWILETFVKVGVPMMAQDWEASAREKADKAARREANRNVVRSSPRGGMRTGALDTYTRVTKPGLGRPPGKTGRKSPDILPLTQPVHSHAAATTVDLASACPIPPTHPVHSHISVATVDLASAHPIPSTQSLPATTASSQRRYQTRFQPPPALPQSPPPSTTVETVALISSPANASSTLPQKRTLQRVHSDTAALGAGLPERTRSPRSRQELAGGRDRRSPRRSQSTAPERSPERSQAARPLRRSPRHAARNGSTKSPVDAGVGNGTDVSNGKENVSSVAINSIDLSMPTASTAATKGSRANSRHPTPSLSDLSSTQNQSTSFTPHHYRYQNHPPTQTPPTKAHSVITISSSSPPQNPQPPSTTHITPRSRARTKARSKHTPSSSGTQTSIRSWLSPGKNGAVQTVTAGRRLNRVEEMIREDGDEDGYMPETPSPVRTGTVHLTDAGMVDEVAAPDCVDPNGVGGSAALQQPDFHSTHVDPAPTFPLTSTPRKSTTSTHAHINDSKPAAPALRFSPRHSHTSKCSSIRTPPSPPKHHKDRSREMDRDRSRRKRKQLIRLRESFEGVFAFVHDVDEEPSLLEDVNMGDGGRVGQKAKSKKREWRVSGVERVDLTGL
ncbi:MAG: hypothetical protein M1831_003801 [Alyxoria varia]|nr:MAG: hypothetical protein M1831_003801 [Alyxoria varia]